MATIAFDTLKLARKLETAGFPTKQAAETAEAFAETIGGALIVNVLAMLGAMFGLAKLPGH